MAIDPRTPAGHLCRVVAPINRENLYMIVELTGERNISHQMITLKVSGGSPIIPAGTHYFFTPERLDVIPHY